MNTYSISATNQQIQDIINYFPEETVLTGLGYIAYQIKYDAVVITIYTSNKVVISGSNSAKYYNLFNLAAEIVLPQSGSDEVGTGDFFGPIVVTASLVDENNYALIKDIHNDDSKQLSDDYICSVAEDLIRYIPHSTLILDNKKYNEVIKTNNLNVIKAKLHNQAYVNLKNKGYQLAKLTVVDDFCGEQLYYKYLKDTPEIVTGLTFRTKAESKYLSVAISSMISRYIFLQQMDMMSKKYAFTFPKGAGIIVDSAIVEFTNRYSIKELDNVAKTNFKNYRKLEQGPLTD